MISFTAASPTFLIAERPKRIDLSFTVKTLPLSLTLGGRTAMPMAFASATKSEILSVLSSSLERSAAMNSTGWHALSHAVWQVMTP